MGRRIQPRFAADDMLLLVMMALNGLALAVRIEAAAVASPAIGPQALVACPFNAMPPNSGCPLTSQLRAGDRRSGSPLLESELSWAVALSCASDRPLPILAGLNYGSGGSFAISLWFKQMNNAGSHQFLYSHSKDSVHKQAAETFSHPAKEVAVGPHSRARTVPSLHVTSEGDYSSFFTNNQIHAFLPGASNPASGVVRTLVRDSTDHGRPTVFLDTDGSVDNFDGIRDNPDIQQVKQGEWHHLVITTHPEPNSKGYAVYLDGAMASLSDKSPSAASVGQTVLPATGGSAMQFNRGNNIHLCQGADADPNSRFWGHLSHLRIFNSSLSPDDIAAVFLNDVQHMTPEGKRQLVVRHMTTRWAHSALAQQQVKDRLHSPSRSLLDAATEPATASTLPNATSPAALAAAVKDDALVFSLLNGELTPGVLTRRGQWAIMVSDSGDVGTSRDILAMPACDRSSASSLPLPISIAQPLPLSGFSVTAWMRLPRPSASAWSTSALGPLPLFSMIGTQQLGITKARVDQTAAAAPVHTRRLQQGPVSTTSQSIDSPVYVPLSVHAYLASATELGVAIIVAVINNAMNSLALNKQLAPDVHTYTALINVSQVAAATPGPHGTLTWYDAAHHVAVVAAPATTATASSTASATATATGQTTTTTSSIGDPLSYSVYIDGAQVGVAALTSVQPSTGTARRRLQDVNSGTGSDMNTWLASRAQTQLATLASRGNTGLLLVCGNDYGNTANMSQTASDPSAPATGRLLLQDPTAIPSAQQQPAAVPGTGSDNTSSTPAPPAQPSSASPMDGPIFQLPPLLDPSLASQNALITDVRIYPSALQPNTVQALWAFGPGLAAHASNAQQPVAASALDPTQTATGTTATPDSTASTSPDPSPTTVHMSRAPWVQLGSGFVPRGSSLDPSVQASKGFSPTDSSTDKSQPDSTGVHRVSVVLPEDQPDGGVNNVNGEHVISTVLPEDRVGNSGNAINGNNGGHLGASSSDGDSNRSVKLGVGLGVALGAVALLAVVALLLYSWQRGRNSAAASCIQLQRSAGGHSGHDQTFLVAYNPGQNSYGSSTATLLSPGHGSTGATTMRTGIKANCATFAAVVLHGGEAVAKQITGLLPIPHSNTGEAGPSSSGPSTPPAAHAVNIRGKPKKAAGPSHSSDESDAPLPAPDSPSTAGHTTIRMSSTTGTLDLPDDLCEPLAGLKAERAHHMPRVGILSPRVSSRTGGLMTPGSPTLFKRAVTHRPPAVTSEDDFVLAPSCLGRIMSGRSGKTSYLKTESDKSMILMPRNLGSLLNPSLMRAAAGGESVTPLATGSRASAANASASMTGAPTYTADPSFNLRGHSMTGLPPANLMLPVTRLSSFSGVSGLAAIPEPIISSPAGSHHRLSNAQPPTPHSGKRGVTVAGSPLGTPRSVAGDHLQPGARGVGDGHHQGRDGEVAKSTVGTPASAGFRHRTNQPGGNAHMD